ncbi:MAG: argininosuccinate synthase [Halothiobacillus sp. 15-55-196]|jgi:argininosuccinate synthase|uniref:argininosuccinate synthase n=1 Tax=Halothiobacillus sp. 15-55-196 TaxID=1970382 RepID=UPI000BD7975B|nr:argininosuccinate synthase [Halothiobacillus sp. 15-55-196]OZB37815.1 MAG: argininosuccinate synthase [Halothiobacillus sp. 15-55-196]
MTTQTEFKKVVLAYSGGLDTSVILNWLEDTYGCEVVTFTADLGQGDELEPARIKAQKMGVRQIFIEDLREEFIRDYVFPMFRANAVYEGEYLLGTSIARPLIAKRLVDIANQTGADAIAHGATGKGNDQVRFELGAYALKPGIKVIAPWREWDLLSREKLMAYAKSHDIPVDFAAAGKKSPYSMDANLLHISYEGGNLEDPWWTPEESMWRWSVSPEAAPEQGEEFVLTFVKGDPVAINGEALSPATLWAKLNKLGGANGVGRLDLVENRYVGMKSRGCYETPGGTIVLKARRALESITLDRGVAHLKDELMPRYAEMIYNGYWWSPERVMLQAAIDASQVYVNGDVRLRLYKGNVQVLGRRSDDTLFDPSIATFEDDAGAYDQRDAAGFIKLNALRLRIAAQAGRKF